MDPIETIDATTRARDGAELSVRALCHEVFNEPDEVTACRRVDEWLGRRVPAVPS